MKLWISTGTMMVAAFVLLAAGTDSRVADAAQRGDAAIIRLFIEQKADVNAAQGDGTTALHWAAIRDDIPLARLLIQAGARVAASTRNGNLTPLLLAAKNGSAAMIQLLLEAGADANSTNSTGTTALMFASAAGEPAALKLLLDRGANVNAKESARGQTALMFAAALNRTDAVKLLLSHGADPKVSTKVTKMERVRVDADGNPIPAGGQTGRGGVPANGAAAGRGGRGGRGGEGAEGLAFRAQAGADGAAAGQPAGAQVAAAGRRGGRGRQNGGSAVAASSDAQSGSDGVPSAPPATGGSIANGRGGPGAQAGEASSASADSAPVRGEGRAQTAEPSVAEAGAVAETTKEPAGRGRRGGQGGEPSAAQAAGGRGGRGGRAGDVAAGGPREVGAPAMGGMTALLLAARDGHQPTVAALLDAGADINQISEADQSSPLVLAIINGHYDLAAYLVNRGANPNLANAAGLTPLYATVDVQWAPHAWYPQPNVTQERISYLELMKVLLEHKADPNLKVTKKLWFRGLAQDPTWVDPSGSTAFWRAAQSADSAAMRLLIDRGADPKIATTQGVTPLMVASGLGWMANHSSNQPDGWTAAAEYCVGLGVDVNAVDSRGYTALHGAAYIGDNELVKFLVAKGAKVGVKSKAGDTVADMANGPTRFGLPHPETVVLLESLGSENSHNCRSDQCLVAPKAERGPGQGGPGTRPSAPSADSVSNTGPAKKK